VHYLKDLMTKSVVTVDVTESVFNAAQIMRKETVAALVVLEDGKPVGILTERDLVRRVLADNLNPVQTKVSEIMSKPLLSANPDASIGEAARIMVDNKIRRLPIVERDRLVGILTAVDLARYLSKITHEIGDKVNWTETLWDAILRSSVGSNS